MLWSLIALVLLPLLIWAAMELAYQRELRYLRQSVHVRTVRLITYWPGMEDWRQAAESLENEPPLVAPRFVPEGAQWQEPDLLPETITLESEPEEPLNVVDITAALESGPTREDADSDGIIAKTPQPRRRSARIRRIAS